jgi:hypothetical protein
MTENHNNIHKHNRTSQEWDEEYSYFDRSIQLKRAKALMTGRRTGRDKGGTKCLNLT